MSDVIFTKDLNEIDCLTQDAHIMAHVVYNLKPVTGLSTRFLPKFVRTEQEIDLSFYTNPALAYEEEISLEGFNKYLDKLKAVETSFPVELLDDLLTGKLNAFMLYGLGVNIHIDSIFLDFPELIELPMVKEHPFIIKLIENLVSFIKLNTGNGELIKSYVERDIIRDEKTLFYTFLFLDRVPTLGLNLPTSSLIKKHFEQFGRRESVVELNTEFNKFLTSVLSANPHFATQRYVQCYWNQSKEVEIELNFSNATIYANFDGKFTINPGA